MVAFHSGLTGATEAPYRDTIDVLEHCQLHELIWEHTQRAHSPSYSVLCIEQAELIVTSGILDLKLVLLPSVLELLCEALLDSRVVAFHKVIVAELYRKRGFTHASGSEESNLSLTRRDGFARWSSCRGCCERCGSGRKMRRDTVSGWPYLPQDEAHEKQVLPAYLSLGAMVQQRSQG